MEGGNEEDERMVRVCVMLMGGLVQSKKKKAMVGDQLWMTLN